MIPLIIILVLGVGAFAMAGTGASENIFGSSTDEPISNDMGLPDCTPLEQQGSIKKDYDDAFMEGLRKHGVPFALLKAHAYRESSINPRAYRQEPNGKASYGLMQVLWWKGSNRFADWGYSDDRIGDGSLLYDPYVNVDIACYIILDNWNNYGNLRDIVNAYNTGRKESIRPAPYDYVNKVLSTYSTLIGRTVS